MPYENVRQLYTRAGIAQGLAQGFQNYQKAKQQKQALAQQKEVFDMDMKLKNLQLQKAEAMGITDPEIIAQNKKILSAQKKQQLASYELGDLMLNQEIARQQNQLQSGASSAQAYQTGLDQGGYEFDYGKVGKEGLPFRRLGETERFRRDLQAAGDSPEGIEELKSRYPDKINQIEKVEQDIRERQQEDLPLEERTLKKGGIFSKAKANKQTMEAMEGIKSYGDLLNIFKNRNALAATGINLKAIINNFREEFAELAEQGLLED